MTIVAVVGAGDIGGAAAHALARSDRVDRVLLVDAARNLASGKALDMQQAAPIGRFHTRLEATDDLSRLVGCSVCVMADRAGTAGEWRGDEGLAMLQEITSFVGEAPLVFAGASQTPLLAAAATEMRIDRRRLIGSATEALRSSITAIVALEARCSPDDVMLTVLGTPPAGFVVPWSEASIGGYALEQVLAQVALVRVQARTAALWPPGPYALGTAAARVSEALVSSSRRSFSVLTQLSGEFGVRNRPGALASTLGPRGIAHIHQPELTTRERVQLQTALGG